MTERIYTIEIEPEVRLWLTNLPRDQYDRVEFYADLLAEQAESLGEPYSRHLGGKLRELRFHLPSRQVRITYWIAPQRRVILLTVFRKTRQRESSEIERARRAQAQCEARHQHARGIYDRDKEER
ncbi:type II toxin-antitoxin system RelE/ParE family toxin [Nocardiopsis gilva YIM 90087]|uniref:Type II toxin-antitoxin system RelE/ParE family toxin n=1 Tax=Nocardiopsis gilva YIM 90087 TaxID=1235441 RepID=A0A223S4V6_9ACTN|nr:type II toxin-antitoxin system RelE/ParE family toxin [Nocardiopsis gilva]ASU83107.1 type II toxin-antitoxin system RelE/ParE family toxin [Nocardiopsis gilva YIM 90087]